MHSSLLSKYPVFLQWNGPSLRKHVYHTTLLSKSAVFNPQCSMNRNRFPCKKSLLLANWNLPSRPWRQHGIPSSKQSSCKKLHVLKNIIFLLKRYAFSKDIKRTTSLFIRMLNSFFNQALHSLWREYTYIYILHKTMRYILSGRPFSIKKSNYRIYHKVVFWSNVPLFGQTLGYCLNSNASID